jgi:hypothetical protein
MTEYGNAQARVYRALLVRLANMHCVLARAEFHAALNALARMGVYT